MSEPTYSTRSTTTVITPPRRWPGAGFLELWQMRQVLFVLANRTFKARYSNMLLGAFWVVLEPLFLTIIITLFLGLILERGDRYGLPFAVFLFAAWTAWRPFSRIVNQGGSSIRANAGLIGRIYLPRAYFPLSVGIVSLIDFLFMVLALVVLLVVFGVSPSIGLLSLPVLLAIMYAFSLGAAYLFSASAMSIPDMDFIRPLLVRSWFWLSPILYSSDIVPPEWRNLYYLNPMVVVIEGMRWAFASTPQPPLEAWLIGASTASVTLVAGYAYFRQREPVFSDQL